jgi:hypothetical protein
LQNIKSQNDESFCEEAIFMNDLHDFRTSVHALSVIEGLILQSMVEIFNGRKKI